MPHFKINAKSFWTINSTKLKFIWSRLKLKFQQWMTPILVAKIIILYALKSKNSTVLKQYQSCKVFNWLGVKAHSITTSVDVSNGCYNLLLLFSNWKFLFPISLFFVATSTVNSCKIWKSVCSQFKVKVALGHSKLFQMAQGQSISR